MSCLWLMLRHAGGRYRVFSMIHAMCHRIHGNTGFHLVREAAVNTALPYVSSFPPPCLVIYKKASLHMALLGRSMEYLWVLLQTLSIFWILFPSLTEQSQDLSLARMRSRHFGASPRFQNSHPRMVECVSLGCWTKLSGYTASDHH